MAADFDKITSLAKRRGFVFQSSEIYGGLNSTWDFGPLGVELKNNIKRAWWRSGAQGRTPLATAALSSGQLRDDIVGLDAAISMAPQVWRASGHLETFTDPAAQGRSPLACAARSTGDCKACKMRLRADHLVGRYARQDEIGTPFCVTVDFETLEDRAVTIRERDSMLQDRVPIAELVPALREKLEAQ